MVYIGTFDQNVFHGKGALSYSENSAYSGDFFHGKRHGQVGSPVAKQALSLMCDREPLSSRTATSTKGNGWRVIERALASMCEERRRSTSETRLNFCRLRLHGKGELWTKRENSGLYRKSVVEYEDGRLVRQRMRPNSKPRYPVQRPLEMFRLSAEKKAVVEEDSLEDDDVYEGFRGMEAQEDKAHVHIPENQDQEPADTDGRLLQEAEASFASSTPDQRSGPAPTLSSKIMGALTRLLPCLPSNSDVFDPDPSWTQKDDSKVGPDSPFHSC
eukprot:755562-Hanusia_phi.AAC.6